MGYALSTSWFARRRLAPEAMVDAAAELGFDALELGYFIEEGAVEALLKRLTARGMSVSSVHAFAPVPIGQPASGPEIFSLADSDEETRKTAVFYLGRSLALAERAGAKAVVLHGGRVRMRKGLLRRPYDSQLPEALRRGDVRGYEDLLASEFEMRRKGAARVDLAFRRSLAEILPRFDRAKVKLCLENLPGIEAYPDPDEFLALVRDYRTPSLAYWHDIGHGEVKARYGELLPEAVFPRLLPFLGGIHIHDVAAPDRDHQAPGTGGVDFAALRFLHEAAVPQVFEPSPNISPQALKAGLEFIKGMWE